jgi:hypothetical protein
MGFKLDLLAINRKISKKRQKKARTAQFLSDLLV